MLLKVTFSSPRHPSTRYGTNTTQFTVVGTEYQVEAPHPRGLRLPSEEVLRRRGRRGPQPLRPVARRPARRPVEAAGPQPAGQAGIDPSRGGGGARSAWGCLTGHGEKYTPQKKYLREPKTTPSKYQSFKISKFALECLFRVHGAFSPCAARGRIGEPWSACPGRPPTFQEGSATR